MRNNVFLQFWVKDFKKLYFMARSKNKMERNPNLNKISSILRIEMAYTSHRLQY